MDSTNNKQQCIFGEPSISALKAWLESLPRANFDAYFDKLNDACRDLAFLNVNSQLALQLLDELRVSVLQQAVRLSHNYLHQSIELPPAAAKVADQTRQLWRSLGDAFMAHAEKDPGFLGRTNNGDPIKPQKTAITCLHRAIHCQQQIILQNILLYRSESEHQWRTMHSRFSLSKQYGVNEHRINDPLNSERPISCITDLYASICLLRIANCNQLNQLEILNLWQFIQKYSVLIELDNGEESTYGIDLVSDLPPLRSEHIASSPQRVSLNYRALIDEIKKQDKGENADISLTHRMREHVLRALSGVITRALPRHNSQGTVDIGFGLSNCWLAFSHRRSLDGMTRHLNLQAKTLEDETNAFMKSRRETFLQDNWDGIFEKHLDNQAEFASQSILAEIRRSQVIDVPEEKLHPQLHKANIIEHSAVGFSLKMAMPLPTPIKNGEVLILREQLDDRYVLGVVRWIRNDTNDVIFGIEVISPRAVCFGARMIPSKGKIENERFSLALLLPAMPALKLGPRLLLPSIPFQEGSKIQMLRDDFELLLKLTHNQQSSFSYSLFDFESFEDALGRIPILGNRITANDERLGALYI